MNFNKEIELCKDEIIKSVQDLIKIRSVKTQGATGCPFGKGMGDALDYVLLLAQTMGFEVKNIDGYCGYIEYGEGELYIGLLSHVDTCHEGELWSVPPFEGKIVQNRIYGRGAMDNKGPLIAALYGLQAVMKSGVKLNKKLRFIIGTDEERYYRDMKYYLSKEKPPIAGFTLDGQFPVVFAEKGLALMEFRGTFRQGASDRISYIRGGTVENTVPGYCEALLISERKSEIVLALSLYAKENRHNMTSKTTDEGVIIRSFGVEMHSMALEMGINAILPILAFLQSIQFGGEEILNVIRFLNNGFGSDLYGKGFSVEYQDNFSGRLSINLGVISFEKDEFIIRFDVRYPVTCNFNETSERITVSFLKNGFECLENTYWDPVYFPKDHFLIKSLLKVYREITGDESESISSGSGSYAKVIPNIVAFGAIFPGESQAWHQVNEYIDIDNLIRLSQIYASAVYELGTTL